MHRSLALLAALVVGCGGHGGSGDPQDAGPGDAAAATDASPGADAAPADAAAGPDAASGDSGTPDGGPVGTGCVEGDFLPFHGDLHAHTSYSDGAGTPADAFAMARDQAGLDIMVVTDHLEQLYELWGLPADDYDDCRDQADAAYVPGTFLADCGFEYGSGFQASTNYSTGHNNVFFSPGLFPMVQLDFHDFFDTLAGCADCVGQFNHPGDEEGQTWGDFALVPAVDANLALFEMSGAGPTWDLLFVALDAGWHVGPQNNQDNHSANWGIANDRRSGLFMAALDRASLREAMLARRTFSSEDANANVRLLAQDTCWMGSRLAGYPQVSLRAEAADPDAGDGFATLELFGPAQAVLATVDCQAQTTCEATHDVTVTAGTYALARATQVDGQVLVSAPIWMAP
jgi:hypothetical protein